MTTDRISGELLRKMLLAAAAELEEHKATVNALNVFPVPDGDTGTNMNLTMQSAIREMGKCKIDTVSEIGKAVALGSLMGARGNSGVILSQLFRGIGRGLEGHAELAAEDLATALQSGVETAYKAVMRPVEGTILTVAREMAQGAVKRAGAGGGPADVIIAAKMAAELALEGTPELLPVLKQAGVVDAGGKGLVVILNGMVRAMESGAEIKIAPVETPAADEGGFQISEELDEITFTYDTQLLIRGTSLVLDELRDELGELGDSMLVVGTTELAKVHIHTNNPGLVLEICLKRGDISDITIDNMREQYEAIKHARAGGNGGGRDEEPGDQAPVATLPVLGEAPPKQVGVVTVAIGDGVERIFRSLGVDVVINGGQTMNPSTEELVHGIEGVEAPEVLLVPNNSNIIMAAQQAIELTGKEVSVIPTRDIPQGISALLAYNPQADLATNQRRMEGAMQGTKTGEITYAVRSTTFEGMAIAEGDVLGIADEAIVATGDEPQAVLERLLDRLIDGDSEFVTVLSGQEVSDEQAEAALAMIGDRYPHVEVEGHRGGQPLFYYLISVE